MLCSLDFLLLQENFGRLDVFIDFILEIALLQFSFELLVEFADSGFFLLGWFLHDFFLLGPDFFLLQF